MAKRKRGRGRRQPTPTVDYTDPEGNVLTLRQSLTPGTIAKINEALGGPGASAEDAWSRRQELLFERLAVRWVAAGLPLTDQGMLIGRYRMIDASERDWVRRILDDHVERHLPELLPG